LNEYVDAYIKFFAYTQKGHNTLLHSFHARSALPRHDSAHYGEEGVPQDLYLSRRR